MPVRRSSTKRRNRIIILVLVGILVFIFGGYLRLLNHYLQITHLRKEIAILKAENEVLRLRINRYRHGKEIVERYARDRLGMKKPSESIILILPNDE